MGLFSFGNQEKDAAPARRSRTSASAERRQSTRGDGERRSGQASLLDPTLPEKQRARRRLVGAIALVLAAVVVLPMVLDSHPKPASDDIAVNIPRQPKAAPVMHANPVSADTQLAPDVTPADQGASVVGAASSPALAHASEVHGGSGSMATTMSAVPRTQTPASASMRVAPQTAVASVAPTNSSTTDGAINAANPSTRSASPASEARPHAASTPAASRYVVSVGAFTSDTSAHAWLSKLKSVGVPAYLETRRQPDGSARILLRAGPFDDRANAEAAVKKVREAGLSAQSNVASGSSGSTGSAQ